MDPESVEPTGISQNHRLFMYCTNRTYRTVCKYLHIVDSVLIVHVARGVQSVRTVHTARSVYTVHTVHTVPYRAVSPFCMRGTMAWVLLMPKWVAPPMTSVLASAEEN